MTVTGSVLSAGCVVCAPAGEETRRLTFLPFARPTAPCVRHRSCGGGSRSSSSAWGREGSSRATSGRSTPSSRLTPWSRSRCARPPPGPPVHLVARCGGLRLLWRFLLECLRGYSGHYVNTLVEVNARPPPPTHPPVHLVVSAVGAVYVHFWKGYRCGRRCCTFRRWQAGRRKTAAVVHGERDHRNRWRNTTTF